MKGHKKLDASIAPADTKETIFARPEPNIVIMEIIDVIDIVIIGPIVKIAGVDDLPSPCF